MDSPLSNSQQPTDDPSTKQWFDSINSSTQIAPIQPPGSKKLRKLTLIILSIVLLAGLVITAMMVVSRIPNTSTCLTSQDYKQLTGKPADPQLSPQAFYTTSFDFKNRTVDFSVSSEKDAETQTKNIGKFYQSHDSDRSIILTVSGDAFDADTLQAASERAALLKNMLIQAGVPESVIRISSPSAVSNDELSTDSPQRASAKAYISIDSSASCK